ncbi:PQQ-binding-like beta-propeller repeat protein, partial [bacterium]|nr:PQQ-binding-like beta-propeller repeat protein [bacterium]
RRGGGCRCLRGHTQLLTITHFDDGQSIYLDRSFNVECSVVYGSYPIDDWPMFRRDIEGTAATDRPLWPPLLLAWVSSVPGMVAHNSPVVKDGRVFLGFRTENDPDEAGVAAFDAQNGTMLWHRHVNGGIALAPAVIGNTLIANALNDSTVGMSAETGQITWSMATPGAMFTQAAPIGTAEGVFVSSNPYGYLVAPESGCVIWKTGYIGPPWFEFQYTAAAMTESRVILNTFGDLGWDGGLDILDRASGQSMVPQISGSYRQPCVAGDTLIVVGDESCVSQVITARTLNGEIHWTSAADVRKGMAAPGLSSQVIVVAGSDGAIKGVDAHSGDEIWSHSVGDNLLDMGYGGIGGRNTLAAPAMTDSIVYIGAIDGYLYALDLFSGEEIWKWYLGAPVASSAALSGNMLFVGCCDGHLYAFRGASDFPTAAIHPDGREESNLWLRVLSSRPGGSHTRIGFNLPRAETVRLSIYDLGGRLVRSLLSQACSAGRQEVIWDGKDASGRLSASGIYLARMTAGSVALTEKIVVVR